MIVVSAPCRDYAAGMAQKREQVLVEALLAHPTVEAFDQAVSMGLQAQCSASRPGDPLAISASC